jgi:flagellar motor switch protein FliM
VVALKPGSQILLNAVAGAAVQIRCGPVTLFEARVGRRKSRVAVRIERDVPRPQPNERSP